MPTLSRVEYDIIELSAAEVEALIVAEMKRRLVEMGADIEAPDFLLYTCQEDGNPDMFGVKGYAGIYPPEPIPF